ncbi:hypothetical protein [Cohnella sp. REN36]|uniref:hypothetical protein n=1 Tax=Cohnella sp. REN36 TaxID=2887347 RepID=UPI001D137B40|nr:hypothetical protein [Cohnella sp. REN36]MCC3374357.1 hypothetical protein [Cohnella sp. REN36]
MKKNQVAAFLGAVFLFLTPSAIVQASNDSPITKDEVITPFYDYISAVGASIDIGSLGKTASSGFVHYSGNYDSTLTVELQRSKGNGWSTVTSWSKSFTGGGVHSLEENYYVTSGYTYRVVAKATIKSGNTVLETASSTSSEVTY